MSKTSLPSTVLRRAIAVEARTPSPAARPPTASRRGIGSSNAGAPSPAQRSAAVPCPGEFTVRAAGAPGPGGTAASGPVSPSPAVVTAVLVLLFGAGPFELSGGAARPEAAAAVHAVGDVTGPRTATRAADHHHHVAPTTTTTVDRRRRPPRCRRRRPRRRRSCACPGSVSRSNRCPSRCRSPPTGSAPVFSRIPTTNKVIFLGIDDGLVKDPAVRRPAQAGEHPVHHVPRTG